MMMMKMMIIMMKMSVKLKITMLNYVLGRTAMILIEAVRKTYKTTAISKRATCQVNQKKEMMINQLQMRTTPKKYGTMSRQNVSSKTSILKQQNHSHMLIENTQH